MDVLNLMSRSPLDPAAYDAEPRLADREPGRGGATRFEADDSRHHDHLIDVETGAVVEFVSAEIERLQNEIAAAHGYEVLHHRHELYCRRIRTGQHPPSAADGRSKVQG